MTSRIVVLLVFSFFCSTLDASAHGGSIACLAALARSSEPTETFNRFMSGKYPKLALVLKDPDAFLVMMRKRFKNFQSRHPDSPYFFDYSEIGMPLVSDLSKNLDRKIGELSSRTNLKITESDRKIALQYLNDLSKESRKILDRGSVAYRELIEFSYFYSRVIGHFDTLNFRLVDRKFLLVDRSLEGYRQLSIGEEYALYRNRKFSVFQMSTTSEGFNRAASTFDRAFEDPLELKQVWVPTNAPLERDVFMRMMFKDIHFVGVTYEPILADGFLRPGGDFWMHDVRHESGKYFEKMSYISKHHLNERQIEAFNKRIDEWALELASANLKVRDHELQDAITHITFNFHHDRGFPLIPSAYLDRKKDFVSYGLYAAMVIGKQGAPFRKPIKNFSKGSAWLMKFWTHRLAEEQAILNELR